MPTAADEVQMVVSGGELADTHTSYKTSLLTMQEQSKNPALQTFLFLSMVCVRGDAGPPLSSWMCLPRGSTPGLPGTGLNWGGPLGPGVLDS